MNKKKILKDNFTIKKIVEAKTKHNFCFAEKFIYKDMCLIIKTNEVQTNQIKLIMRNKSISCYNFVLIIIKIIKSDLQMRTFTL